MRTLNKNKQKMYYAQLVGEGPDYVYDENGNKIVEYETEEGEKIYKETGGTQLLYSKPVLFSANISFSGSGEATAQEFGIDVSQYDAVLVYGLNKFPITETSLVWYNEEPQYKDADKTVLNDKSATFTVKAIKPSLNFTRALLGAITK